MKIFNCIIIVLLTSILALNYQLLNRVTDNHNQEKGVAVKVISVKDASLLGVDLKGAVKEIVLEMNGKPYLCLMSIGVNKSPNRCQEIPVFPIMDALITLPNQEGLKNEK